MDFKEFLIYIGTIFGNASIKEIAAKLKDNDTAIDDELSEKLKEAVEGNMANFLSMEAAQNNPTLEKHFKAKLFPTLKGELLGNLDTEIDGMAASLLGADDVREIIGIENTKEKLKAFSEKAKDVLKKRFKGTELEDKLTELQAKYNSMQEQHAEALTKKESEYNDAKMQWQDKFVKNIFTSSAKQYQWQESLKKEHIQPYLIDQLYEKIKSKATFVMSDTGEIEVYQKDNPGTFLFEGNKKLGFKDLLEKEIDPYLDKAPAKKTFIPPTHLSKAPGDRPAMYEAMQAGADQYKNK